MNAEFNNKALKSNPTLKWASFLVDLNWWLGWVAAGMLLILVSLMLFLDFDIRYSTLPLEVSLAEDSAGEVLQPIHSAGSIPIVGFKSLRIFSSDLPGLQYMMLSPTILLAGFLWIAWLLRRFLFNVKRGEMFSSENPQLLIRIGWLVVLSEPVYRALVYLYGRVYLSAIEIPGASIAVDNDFHGLGLLAGLVILVIAQVYRAAVTMKTEADLTI